MKCKAVVLALLVCVPRLASAQTTTTLGTLTLTPTFTSLSVYAPYTGDSDSDNSAVLQYRPQGTSTWRDVYTASSALPANGSGWWPDRRALIGAVANPYLKQFRASIVGLTPGTTYEVQVTVADPDGLVGASTLSGLVTMLSPTTVVAKGNTFFVDASAGAGGNGSSATPWNTMATALAGSVCGDTLNLRPGTYAAWSFTKTCTGSTWYRVLGQNRDTTIIAGATSVNVTINGSFLQIKNVTMASSNSSNVTITTNNHDLWFENITFAGIADTAGGNNNCAGHYNDSNINVLQNTSGQYHLYVIGNSFRAPIYANGNCSLGFNSPSAGVYINSTMHPTIGGNVIADNDFNEAVRDCVGNSPESFTTYFNDSDILNNTFIGCRDDPIQMEARDVNLREGGNLILANAGYSAIAHQVDSIGVVGPIYIYRNYGKITSPSQVAFKVTHAQGVVLLQNTWDITGDGIMVESGADSNRWTARNNIFKTTLSPIYGLDNTETSFDYNAYFRIGGGALAHHYSPGNADYTSLCCAAGSFFAAQGQEQHGISGDPGINATTGTIANTSTAYNHGITLPNFNDATSAWPAYGAPDVGYAEVNVVPANPVSSLNCTGLGGRVASAGSVTAGQPLTVTGCTFGASIGSGSLKLCDASTFAASLNCVTQAVATWADTKLIVTSASVGSLGYGPVYLYVTPNGGSPQANGLPVTLAHKVF